MLNEDAEIQKQINGLLANREVFELVKAMQPLDIATCIQSAFDIVPKNALVITLNLLKNAKLQELTTVGSVTNQYPIPSIKRREHQVDEDVGGDGRPEIAIATKSGEFPPPPRSNAQKWPYDPNTLFITDPTMKGGVKSITSGYEPVAKSKKSPNRWFRIRNLSVCNC